MAVELKSSFTPGRDLVTQLPGGQAPGGYPDLPPALLALLMARASKPTPQPTAAPRVAAQQPSRQNSQPTMGTSQSAQSSGPQVVTRLRSIPKNPYDAMSRIPGGIGGTGDTNNARIEKGYVGKNGEIQWEFDGAGSAFEEPHGGGGGVFGGGGEPSGPTPDLQERMPAYKSGSPSSGFDDKTGMIRPQEQPRAMNRADLAQAVAMPRRIGGRIGGGFR